MSSKSTFSNSTSKSYALALYELAKENSEINKAEEGINGLKVLLNKIKITPGIKLEVDVDPINFS